MQNSKALRIPELLVPPVYWLPKAELRLALRIFISGRIPASTMSLTPTFFELNKNASSMACLLNSNPLQHFVCDWHVGLHLSNESSDVIKSAIHECRRQET